MIPASLWSHNVALMFTLDPNWWSLIDYQSFVRTHTSVCPVLPSYVLLPPTVVSFHIVSNDGSVNVQRWLVAKNVSDLNLFFYIVLLVYWYFF